MDAISFVLGIKSSHLRSAHLRDLVYRGRVLKTSVIQEDGSATTNGVNGHATADGDTQTDAAGNPQERHDPKSAWVMAVYDDDAGDEQRWKRSITNQGVSEYRINNRPVTAQQYNEALEAENILIKARNFLVFQGDVEAIAAQRPSDLTRLIEQISGSLEHKAEYERRKEVHEQALEHQTFALNRRRGINSEIKQYQEQKREADNYEHTSDQRDQAIVAHILWKLYHLQRAVDESTAEIETHQEELKEHRRGIVKYERALEQAKVEQATVGKEVTRVERAIKSKEKQIDEKEHSLLPLVEKIHLTHDRMTKANARVASITKERDARQATLTRLRKDLKSVEKAEAEWMAEWKKLGEQDGRVLTDVDLHEYHQLKEEANKKSSADKLKADHLARQQRTDQETVNSLKSKLDAIQYQVKQLEDDSHTINDQKSSIESQSKHAITEMETKKKELNSLTSERLRVAQLRTELDEKLQDVLTKLLDAEDGRKQSDKQRRLKETIATMKRMFPGVRGRVSDLCKPKQKKYGDAVSTVLGRHFDAVVVDDEKTAKECIQFLREQHRGQATFIPLDTIQVKTLDSHLKGLHRGTRMAIDTIDYDKSVDRAMSYACGNAIVCDDLATAKYVCYEKGVEAKAVTLDGMVIHKGGLMTGGRGRESNARRWEDADVDGFRKIAEKLQRDLAALPEPRRNASEEEALQNELAGLEQRVSWTRDEIKAHDRNLLNKKKELDTLRRALKEVEPQYRSMQRDLDKLKSNLKSFQDAISAVEDEVFQSFCNRLMLGNIRIYEAQQGSLQQEGAQKRLEFRQQRSKLESRINLEQQLLQETENRITLLESRAKQDQSLIDDLEAQKAAVSEESNVLAEDLDELREELERQQNELVQRSEKVAEQRRELQKRSKHVDGALRAVAGLEAVMQRSSADRYALLRRCKLEDITIPLEANSNGLDQLPIDGMIQMDDAMDVDEDPETTIKPAVVQDYGIEVDFDELENNLKQVSKNESGLLVERSLTIRRMPMRVLKRNCRRK